MSEINIPFAKGIFRILRKFVLRNYKIILLQYVVYIIIIIMSPS